MKKKTSQTIIRFILSFIFLFIIAGYRHPSKVSKRLIVSQRNGRISEGSNVYNTLPFVIQKQSALNLCWAAVASSVSTFYDNNSTFSQCKLANYAQNKTSCCKDLTKCDTGWSLDSALLYTGNLSGQIIEGIPSFDLIKNEITNARVICLRIEWNSGGGHFIVIHGFHDGEKLDVQDPWPDKNPGTLTLTEIAIFYQDMGRITHYYLTTPFPSAK